MNKNVAGSRHRKAKKLDIVAALLFLAGLLFGLWQPLSSAAASTGARGGAAGDHRLQENNEPVSITTGTSAPVRFHRPAATGSPATKSTGVPTALVSPAVPTQTIRGGVSPSQMVAGGAIVLAQPPQTTLKHFTFRTDAEGWQPFTRTIGSGSIAHAWSPAYGGSLYSHHVKNGGGTIMEYEFHPNDVLGERWFLAAGSYFSFRVIRTEPPRCPGAYAYIYLTDSPVPIKQYVPLEKQTHSVRVNVPAAEAGREIAYLKINVHSGRGRPPGSPICRGQIDFYVTQATARVQATAFETASVTLDVLDPEGNPVTAPLDLNDEGWPNPNPLTVTVRLNCPAGGGDCGGPFNLEMNPVDNPRFHINNRQPNFIPAEDFVLCDGDILEEALYSYENYGVACSQPGATDLYLPPGATKTMRWSVWVQPSEAAVLNVSASWGRETATKTVTIPTAEIHPVVFVHGILGSMPPHDGTITTWPQNLGTYAGLPAGEAYLDPWVDSYRPLLETLLKMGYELDESLFIVTYDWRQSNRRSASHLREVLGSDVQTKAPVYVVAEPGEPVQADVVVHSMGGLVLRAYLEDLATTGGYEGNVNKAVTIASPHQGFPATYNTYEGLTWEDYFSNELGFLTNPGWGTGSLRVATDQLVWPYFILKRYNPQPEEPCRGGLSGNLAVLNNGLGCPLQALYHFSHATDPDRGIRSLPEMLPPGQVEPAFLKNEAGEATPYGTTLNPLLDHAGLNSASGVAKLKRLGNDEAAYDNLYVIYNAAQAETTPFVYTVDEPVAWPVACYPSRETPLGACPFGEALIPAVRQWVHGKPTEVTNDDGDGLIPAYSTQLSEVLRQATDENFPDPDNQELAIDLLRENNDSGHVLIMVEQQTQSIIGAILTGLVTPEEAQQTSERDGADFPIFTKYRPPVVGLNNLDAVLTLLVWSPVDVLVTDPLGRRVGFDPAGGTVVNEIPGAFYSGAGVEEEFLLIPSALDGPYQVTTQGTDNGEFAITGHLADTAGTQVIDVMTGTATTGQVVTQTLVYSPNRRVIFADDLESGPGNWLVDNSLTSTATLTNTWTLTTGVTGPANTYSPPTVWAVGQTGVMTPGQPLTLTLKVPLDLSQARRVRLTYWYSASLSAETQGVVEGSTDDGQSWFTLAHQPTRPAPPLSTTLTGWNRRALDLSPFSGPDKDTLRLRFRLIPGAADDRWQLDEVRVEEIIVPGLFGFPFADDVEGLRYWDSGGDWARTDRQAHSGVWAWRSGSAGEPLTLAGQIPIPANITPTLTFWQVVSPTTQGVVDLSSDNGATWTPIYTLTTAQPDWGQVGVTLEDAGGLTATLRFRQTAGPPGGWRLDDFGLDHPPANGFAFVERGGQVIAEAEHFHRQAQQDRHLWLGATGLPGYAGPGYLVATPDVGARLSGNEATTGPELRYTLAFTTPGLYYLWLRGYAPNAAGDSVHVGLAGLPQIDELTGFAPRQWDWANLTTTGDRATLQIPEAGRYTLHLWLREDGLRLDRLLLTTAESYTPTGAGPPESEQRVY